MTDIVERLRSARTMLCAEAADYIVELREALLEAEEDAGEDANEGTANRGRE